jgi:hypothetical protein
MGAVAGIGDPGRELRPISQFMLAGIIDESYSIRDSISPCQGHSLDFLTNPALTGFSLT